MNLMGITRAKECVLEFSEYFGTLKGCLENGPNYSQKLGVLCEQLIIYLINLCACALNINLPKC